MKYKASIFILFFIMMPVAVAFAQNQVSTVETIDVDIWPDYDRPSVLVLLTGKLPEDTTLPASVTLPLPETAQLNAVARIDSKDGHMKDDILSSTDPPGMLTFTTPDLRFRVEYYFPYAVNEKQHSFDYTWLAPIGVKVFRLSVQQPSSADAFTAEPPIATIMRGDDGFEYHTFPTQAVEAWQPVSLKVDYNMTGAQLSKKRVPPSNTNTQPAASPPNPSNGSGINWALVAMVIGGLLIFGALIREFVSRRSSTNSPKSAELQSQKRSDANCCHKCGESVVESDKYCSGCGDKL